MEGGFAAYVAKYALTLKYLGPMNYTNYHLVAFFKNRVITALFLQSFLLGAVYQAYLYYLPLYYQNGRGWDPIVSAALTAPMVTCQSIASVCSGQYISRIKRYGEIIWVGFGLWTL